MRVRPGMKRKLADVVSMSREWHPEMQVIIVARRITRQTDSARAIRCGRPPTFDDTQDIGLMFSSTPGGERRDDEPRLKVKASHKMRGFYSQLESVSLSARYRSPWKITPPLGSSWRRFKPSGSSQLVQSQSSQNGQGPMVTPAYSCPLNNLKSLNFP